MNEILNLFSYYNEAVATIFVLPIIKSLFLSTKTLMRLKLSSRNKVKDSTRKARSSGRTQRIK